MISKEIKRIIIIIIAIFFLLSVVSCNYENNSINYNITFVYNDDNNSTSIKFVKYNKTLAKPKDPTRTNFLFDGWYRDSNFENIYDFSSKVTSSFTLYAKWDIDYKTLTNTITTSIMKANVTIVNKSYNTFLFIETNSYVSSGSGIIFHLSDKNNYFVLTNNHVTVKQNGYDYQQYTVIDYLGNEYTGTRLHQSAEYDLAVIYFQKSRELKILEREKNNLSINADIISLGQPQGQSNAITYGKIQEYKSIKLNDTPTYKSNVGFNIMAHNAPTASGSSGGAILSLNLKIAGIHYAGSRNSKNEFVQGYALPSEKINEYLDKNVFKTSN